MEKFPLHPVHIELWAHIRPMMNLASQAYLVDGENVLEIRPIDARGCMY